MIDIRVTESSKLDRINEPIHDYWFNVDEVAIDTDGRIVRVPFVRHAEPHATGRGKPRTEWWLEIRSVDECTLEDTQGVGYYDFNEVHFDEVKRTVTITTGIPLKFSMSVGDLDVRVCDTGKTRDS